MVLYQQFSVDGTDYLYDTGTNAIVPLPDGVSRWLDDLVLGGGDPDCGERAGPDHRAAAAFFDRARGRSGLLASHPPRDYRGILEEERIRTRLDHGMRGLLLGVTDGCNQRCSYCIYSGSYKGQRTHGTGRMSWEVARRSIDFFAGHVADASPIFVTFYGGEPLLAWELVRRCVEYTRGLGLPGLILLLNTNLTLLDEARAGFLAQNDVALAVSLDGPATVHDPARRFASGKPTHSRVVHWLEYIRAAFPAYWEKNVVLHATFDRHNDIEEVFDFFCGEPWRDLPITVGGVRLEGRRGCGGDRDASLRHQAAMDRLAARHLSALESGEPFPHRLFRNLFRPVFRDLPARRIGYPPVDAHPMRTCTPGVTRLYVDSQGVFYPCEKTGVPAARIGDIDHGIDLGKVRHLLLRQVRFCESDCQGCWAWRLCSLCLTHFLRGGEIRWRAVRRKCEEERERIRRSLEHFTHLYTREPPSTWDHPFSLHRAVEEGRRAQEEG